MGKFIAFRGDKELAEKLKRDKERMGFKSDADYMRYLVRNNELVPNLMNIKNEINQINKKLDEISKNKKI